MLVKDSSSVHPAPSGWDQASHRFHTVPIWDGPRTGRCPPHSGVSQRCGPGPRTVTRLGRSQRVGDPVIVHADRRRVLGAAPHRPPALMIRATTSRCLGFSGSFPRAETRRSMPPIGSSRSRRRFPPGSSRLRRTRTSAVPVGHHQYIPHPVLVEHRSRSRRREDSRVHRYRTHLVLAARPRGQLDFRLQHLVDACRRCGDRGDDINNLSPAARPGDACK